MGEHYDRYNGMQELPATDINAATKDGTNLASLGTDCISREQAIDGKICIQRANGVEIYDDYAVPVEYLKQLPPANCSEFPNNSDTISRQAAIDYFVLNVGFHDEDGYPIEDTDELRKIWTEYFDGIPSAQPKRSRWLYCEDSTADCVDGYRCDQCGFFVPWDYQHKSIDYIKDYNFCPKCGSYNGGEKE